MVKNQNNEILRYKVSEGQQQHLTPHTFDLVGL